VASSAGAAKSLPLILARELGANLATPMFLIDAEGMLVFYNEAAELLIGRPFAGLGEIPSLEFGETLQLADADGTPLRRRDSPAGLLRAAAVTSDGRHHDLRRCATPAHRTRAQNIARRAPPRRQIGTCVCALATGTGNMRPHANPGERLLGDRSAVARSR
jgi:hypothetical protein